MVSRPIRARVLLILLATVGVLLSGCSSSGPQDMNIGTDVALGWVPPDGSVVSIPDAAVDAAGSPEVADTTDGGIGIDASTDEGG